MRRLPQIVSFLLFIALCASIAYWAMQLFKPPVRPVAAPPRVAQAEIRPDAAASLFGNRKGAEAVASNYQLRGVIFSGSPRNSVAIISADGKPAQAIRVDQEIAPGVTIKEVHRDYILLSEGGATKRVELPESAKGLDGIAAAPAAAPPPRTVTPPPPPPVATQPVPSRAQAAAAAQAGQPVPGVPPVQPAPQVMTPQTAPSPPPPTQPPVPGAGQVPQTTTAPPTTVVSPAPGVPGTAVVPGTVPVQPVPGAVPPVPAR